MRREVVSAVRRRSVSRSVARMMTVESPRLGSLVWPLVIASFIVLATAFAKPSLVSVVFLSFVSAARRRISWLRAISPSVVLVVTSRR